MLWASSLSAVMRVMKWMMLPGIAPDQDLEILAAAAPDGGDDLVVGQFLVIHDLL